MIILINIHKEPKVLRRGKEFHKEIQNDWLQSAEGKVKPEMEIIKPSGRKGRIDIFVESNDELYKKLDLTK